MKVSLGVCGLPLHHSNQDMIHSVFSLLIKNREHSINVFLQYKRFVSHNSLWSCDHNLGFSYSKEG